MSKKERREKEMWFGMFVCEKLIMKLFVSCVVEHEIFHMFSMPIYTVKLPNLRIKINL